MLQSLTDGDVLSYRYATVAVRDVIVKQQFQAGLCAAANGGHIRVGLEDNVRVVSGEKAKGSYEQVEWAVEVAKIAGRDVASPDDARKILGLRGK